MSDVAIRSSVTTSAPKDYTIPGAQELLLKAVRATYDGSGAAGAYLTCLQLLSPDGTVMWTAFPGSSVAAGASADVSWFPDVGTGAQSGSTPSTGSGITSLTSPTGTLTVTNTTGPLTNVDMPTTGVSAGSYGDGAHVGQFTVDAEGRLTAASSVAISGTGTFTTIFDSTLSSSAATIDTGAGGIPGGFTSLQIAVVGRNDTATFSDSFYIYFNNDGVGSHYQFIWTDNSNGVSSSFISLNTGGIKLMEGPGANIGAGIFGVAHATIPAYAQTTANKAVTALGGFAETSGHSELVHLVGTWNSTAAITRITFASSGNLVAGSRMTIYGLP